MLARRCANRSGGVRDNRESFSLFPLLLPNKGRLSNTVLAHGSPRFEQAAAFKTSYHSCHRTALPERFVHYESESCQGLQQVWKWPPGLVC